MKTIHQTLEAALENGLAVVLVTVDTQRGVLGVDTASPAGLGPGQAAAILALAASSLADEERRELPPSPTDN